MKPWIHDVRHFINWHFKLYKILNLLGTEISSLLLQIWMKKTRPRCLKTNLSLTAQASSENHQQTIDSDFRFFERFSAIFSNFIGRMNYKIKILLVNYLNSFSFRYIKLLGAFICYSCSKVLFVRIIKLTCKCTSDCLCQITIHVKCWWN